jgi:hypothetical protein
MKIIKITKTSSAEDPKSQLHELKEFEAFIGQVRNNPSPERIQSLHRYLLGLHQEYVSHEPYEEQHKYDLDPSVERPYFADMVDALKFQDGVAVDVNYDQLYYHLALLEQHVIEEMKEPEGEGV